MGTPKTLQAREVSMAKGAMDSSAAIERITRRDGQSPPVFVFISSRLDTQARQGFDPRFGPAH